MVKTRFVGFLLAAGLIAAVVGAKAYVIYHFGSDVPFSDQWAKEGGMIIDPYYRGQLHASDFFVPHNEHRIAPTLALNLFWVICSGQWDGRVQCVANAFLAVGIALALVAFAWRRFSPGWGLAAAWMGAGLGVLPLVWEDTLEGFQSQYYFAIGFSLGAIYGLLDRGGARSTRWWIGLACAALAAVSLGSGFLCVAPVALIALIRVLGSRPPRAADLATLVVGSAATAAGWLFRARAPWHEAIHSHSAGQFLLFSVRCLAWPCPQWPALAALIWLPWVLLVALAWRRSAVGSDPRAEFVLAAGVWVLLQIAALAYSRGMAMSGMPSNRYGDVLALGFVLNLFAWYFLSVRYRALIWGWAAVLAATAVFAALPAWNGMLPALRAQYQLTDGNVRDYVRTGNPAYLKPGQVPFPDPATLGELLRRPVLRAILPVDVHASPARESALSAAVRRFCLWSGGVFWLGLAALAAATVSWLAGPRSASARLPRFAGSSPPGSG